MKKIIKKEKRNVYFSDLVNSVQSISNEMLAEAEGHQHVCCMCFNREDIECNCVKNKQIRDGGKQTMMSSGLISIEEAERFAIEIAIKIFKDLKQKSFILDCPPEPGKRAFLAKQKQKLIAIKNRIKKQKNIKSNNKIKNAKK